MQYMPIFFSPSSVQIQISYNSDDFKIWTKLTLTVVKLIAEGTRRQMFQNVDENKLIQTSQTAPSIHIMIKLCYFSLVQCTMTFPKLEIGKLTLQVSFSLGSFILV